MIVGVITTKDILTHPMALVTAVGVIGYVHLLLKCFDSKPHRFVQVYFEIQKGVKHNG